MCNIFSCIRITKLKLRPGVKSSMAGTQCTLLSKLFIKFHLLHVLWVAAKARRNYRSINVRADTHISQHPRFPNRHFCPVSHSQPASHTYPIPFKASFSSFFFLLCSASFALCYHFLFLLLSQLIFQRIPSNQSTKSVRCRHRILVYTGDIAAARWHNAHASPLIAITNTNWTNAISGEKKKHNIMWMLF